jgi:hypothetical protein
VKRPAARLPAAVDAVPDGQARWPDGSEDFTHQGVTARGPVVMLSYAHSGAGWVQNVLGAESGLACTSSTGILPLCAAPAETWRRIEGQAGQKPSRLAVCSIRGLVTAQMTAILAQAGAGRWCELATADSSSAEVFLQIFPGTAFVCVHRRCLEVIRTGVQASPWGLAGQGLTPYLLVHPGNSVAALAAYWANAAADLLAFEQAHHGIVYRVRSEDVLAEPDKSLRALRAGLGLNRVGPTTSPGGLEDMAPGAQAPSAAGPWVPVEMIPIPLHQQVRRIEAELGYESALGEQWNEEWG